MKKVIPILSALMVLLALTACAGKATKPTYVGNWELDHAVIDGTAYTRAELKAIGQDANMKLLLKENGKAFLTVDTDSEVLNWSETKNGIQVGNAKFSMEDGLLCGGTDDAIVYFKKVPESRLNEEQADKATQEAETKSPETTALATEATTEPTVEATTEPTTAPTTEATTEPTTEATSQELLDAVKPELALISVGANNSYGHPTQEVLDRLTGANCTIRRTDLEGTIVIRRNSRGKKTGS